MNNKRLGIIILIILMGTPFSSLSADVIVLRTAAQESYPKYYKLGDQLMGGICVDIMQAIENENPKIKFAGYQEFLPFKRLQAYLELGQLDVFFGFKKTEIRVQSYAFVDIPLYEINYVVAIRTDSKVNIKSFDDIRALGKKGTILTIYGTAASRFLHKQGGLFVDDAAKTPLVALKKLKSKRGNFVFYHDLGLKSLIKRGKLAREIKILPVSFSTYYHYVAFQKNTSLKTFNQVKSTLEKLNVNGELSRIRRKYSLTE